MRVCSVWSAFFAMLAPRNRTGILILDAAMDEALREEYMRSSVWWNDEANAKWQHGL